MFNTEQDLERYINRFTNERGGGGAAPGRIARARAAVGRAVGGVARGARRLLGR